jgi:hypothetical protein
LKNVRIKNITNLQEKRLQFECNCCKKISGGKMSIYEWHLSSGGTKTICGKCAKRELGSKNKTDWERLHAK